MKKASSGQSAKQVQDRVYQIMSVLAGDLSDYEEALRAMYKKDKKSFLGFIEKWPNDVQNYLLKSSLEIFEV
jgi:hypothetical protein